MSNSAIVTVSDNVREWFAKTTIAAYFAAMGVPTPTVGTTGWKQRSMQFNQGAGQANRVLFIPGTLDAADEGTLEEPRRVGGAFPTGSQFAGQPSGSNPRALVMWKRIITASVWAVDNAAPGNLDLEELQIAASDNLLEMTIQALVHTCQADVVFTRVRRDPTSPNLRFGREVLLEFIHREKLNDLILPVVTGVATTVVRNPSS